MNAHPDFYPFALCYLIKCFANFCEEEQELVIRYILNWRVGVAAALAALLLATGLLMIIGSMEMQKSTICFNYF